MPVIIGIAILITLFTVRWLLRRWFWRQWLAGRFSVNRGALVLTFLTSPFVLMVVAALFLIRGEAGWPFFLGFAAISILVAFPVVRWTLRSLAPAPGSGSPDAPSLLEESMLKRIHRDPD